ncbi:hypothetical protein [Streptosporangium sp. H16]|uniref:hypothetical protein n=1 Tax=Streptosporangium sp. H16 TaxID=3444184 RepID=UPI003F7A03B4
MNGNRNHRPRWRPPSGCGRPPSGCGRHHLRDGNLHSSTAAANVDELEVDRLAGRKSLAPGVVETWVSWRTSEDTVRRYYAAGGRL